MEPGSWQIALRNAPAVRLGSNVYFPTRRMTAVQGRLKRCRVSVFRLFANGR